MNKYSYSSTTIEPGIYYKSHKFYVYVRKVYIGKFLTVNEAREARESGLANRPLRKPKPEKDKWNPLNLIDDKTFGSNLRAMTIYNNNKNMALGSSRFVKNAPQELSEVE